MKPINRFQLFKKTACILSLFLFLTLIVFSCIDDDDLFNQCPTCEDCEDCPDCPDTTCPDCPDITCPDTTCPACICDSFPISPITITSLSTDFLIVGETLTINGKNFINDSIGTKVVINRSSFYVKPTSNTEIKLQITEEMSTKRDSLFVQIGDSVSLSRHFFVVPKGWYKIDAFDSFEIQKSFVFDDTNYLISLIDSNTGTGFTGNIERLKTDSTGYKRDNIRPNSPSNLSLSNLEMYNKDVGVYIGPSGTVNFTSDSFETINSFENFSQGEALQSQLPDHTTILFESETSCIISDNTLAHVRIRANDVGGAIISFTRRPDILSSLINPINYIAKAVDGYFYSLGIKAPRSSPRTHLVLKSENFIDWDILDDTTPSNGGFTEDGNTPGPKFIDINCILSTSRDGRPFEKSTDMGKSWEAIENTPDPANFPNGVRNFFIRSKDEWYIVSADDMLYSTKNGGSTWNREELGSLKKTPRINHMFFSENKIVLSGVDEDGVGVLYIKHE